MKKNSHLLMDVMEIYSYIKLERVYPRLEINAILDDAIQKIQSYEHKLKKQSIKYKELLCLLMNKKAYRIVLKYCTFYAGDKITNCIKILKSKSRLTIRIIIKDMLGRIMCPLEMYEKNGKLITVSVNRDELT
jgi:hypothetical protein